MKILETERLILREYTADDFDALFAIVGDAETMKHFPKPYSEKGTRYWIDWSLDHCRRHGYGFWAVILKETGTLIGNCGITMQNIDGEILPEIGYHFHKDHWRKGYAKEICRAVLEWGFTHTEYDTFWSYMTAGNTASIATAYTMGMKKIKSYDDDHYGHMFACAVTRAEWEALRK